MTSYKCKVNTQKRLIYYSSFLIIGAFLLLMIYLGLLIGISSILSDPIYLILFGLIFIMFIFAAVHQIKYPIPTHYEVTDDAINVMHNGRTIYTIKYSDIKKITLDKEGITRTKRLTGEIMFDATGGESEEYVKISTNFFDFYLTPNDLDVFINDVKSKINQNQQGMLSAEKNNSDVEQ